MKEAIFNFVFFLRFLDQLLVSIQLDKFLILNPNTRLVKIHLSKRNRLDRELISKNWLKLIEYKFHQLIDCHSFQSDVFQNWYLLQPLLLKLFDHETKVLFDIYYAEYSSLIAT